MPPDMLPAVRLAATLAVGTACGIAFKRLKVPAGYMVGAFAGVSVLNCALGLAWVPDGTRTLVQMVAGAFVGCSMERGDLKRLGKIGGPVAVMLAACLVLMLAAGAAIYLVSPLDLVTSLMCAVPGGINDTPIVAADMGADAPAVAVLQLVRQVLGIAVLPALIAAFDRLRTKQGKPGDRSGSAEANACGREKSGQRSGAATLAALGAAGAAGLAGSATGVPGMTFTFSIAAVLALKLGLDFAYIPKRVKKACQTVAGCYLGTLITPGFLDGIPALALPIAVVVAAYTANCLITGALQRKLFGYGRREGMLIASPAGASDMALIMDDMGLRNTDVVIMQVIRAVVVMALFPQIVNLICFVAEEAALL